MTASSDRTRVKNIGGAFLAMAARNPDLLAIVTDEAVLSYAQLAEVTMGFAARLHRAGVGHGSLVCLDSDDIMAGLPVVLATALVGSRWISYRSQSAIPEAATPTHWFATPGTGALTERGATCIDDSWFENLSGGGSDDFSGPISEDAPWLLVNTSGTTGSPKRLEMSQAIMLQRAHAVREDFIERKTVFTTFFACHAFPFLTRSLACLTNGCTIVQSRDFGLWSAAGVNHVYGSVTQVSEALGATVLPVKFPLIHVSGSHLGDGLAAHLLKGFDQVIDLYASSETNRSFKNIKYLDAGGAVATRGQRTDAEIEIISDTGALCAPGEIGTVRVKNPYLVANYVNNPEARNEALRDGWFYSGDLGSWGENGQLQFVGRKGDVINIGGVKINALATDQALRAVDGIVDAMCFEDATGDGISKIVAFVIFQPDADRGAVAATANAACAAKVGPSSAPSRLIEVNFIPRAHDGGAQRFLCKQLYADMKRGS